jgi:hypothetical protein
MDVLIQVVVDALNVDAATILDHSPSHQRAWLGTLRFLAIDHGHDKVPLHLREKCNELERFRSEPVTVFDPLAC